MQHRLHKNGINQVAWYGTLCLPGHVFLSLRRLDDRGKEIRWFNFPLFPFCERPLPNLINQSQTGEMPGHAMMGIDYRMIVYLFEGSIFLFVYYPRGNFLRHCLSKLMEIKRGETLMCSVSTVVSQLKEKVLLL